MPTTNQIANRLYKELLGVGHTDDSKAFFEEGYAANKAVLSADIWAQSELIPEVCPLDFDSDPNNTVNGVVKIRIDVPLPQVPGSPFAYQSDELKDAIPFNFGDKVSYKYRIKPNAGGTPITDSKGEWTVDTNNGILLFNDPSGLPVGLTTPVISFFQYVGEKGISAGDVPSSRQVTGSGSLDGGGDLSEDVVITLEGDEENPGAHKFYGTDSEGNKGFFEVSVQTSELLYTVTQTDSDLGYIILPQAPTSVAAVEVNPLNGPIQVSAAHVGATGVTPDFEVVGTNICINNNASIRTVPVLSEHIVVGDVINIIY